MRFYTEEKPDEPAPKETNNYIRLPTAPPHRNRERETALDQLSRNIRSLFVNTRAGINGDKGRQGNRQRRGKQRNKKRQGTSVFGEKPKRVPAENTRDKTMSLYSVPIQSEPQIIMLVMTTTKKAKRTVKSKMIASPKSQ